MPRICEFLQYLLENGVTKVSELYKIWGHNEVNALIGHLKHTRLIERCIRLEVKTPIGVMYRYIVLKPHESAKRPGFKGKLWVRLSKHAYKYLEKTGSKNFYETPATKRLDTIKRKKILV
jgi:hypothetical protein